MNPDVPKTVASAKLWWAAPVGILLVLFVLILLFGRSQDSPLPRTSYDASSEGVRAAYLLLEELRYPVRRSRRLGGEAPRWVLFPRPARDIPRTKDVRRLDAWVREGGVLLLADRSPDFAHALGMDLQVETNASEREEPASGGGATRLAGGNVRVDWPGHEGRVWARIGDRPVVSVHEHGQGQIWLLQRPELITNRLVGKADNGVLVCRLAEAMLQERPGEAPRLAIDEYFHGLRDRPGVIELLLRPPALWVTLQALLLTLLLLWHYIPRFGVLRPLAEAGRRSQEEFLDAMAALLARKGDYTEAFHTARADLLRQMERELGLPAGSSIDRVIREAVKRRAIRLDTLVRVLADGESEIRTAKAFLKAMNELEKVRHEFIHGQQHR
jgi:hypothetical protein